MAAVPFFHPEYSTSSSQSSELLPLFSSNQKFCSYIIQLLRSNNHIIDSCHIQNYKIIIQKQKIKCTQILTFSQHICLYFLLQCLCHASTKLVSNLKLYHPFISINSFIFIQAFVVVRIKVDHSLNSLWHFVQELVIKQSTCEKLSCRKYTQPGLQYCVKTTTCGILVNLSKIPNLISS